MKNLLTGLLIIFILPLMAYSTNSDLYERMDEQLVIQLTDDDQTGTVDQTVLDDKRDTCEEIVNSHLRGRYDVPMDPAPKMLADIEADLLVDKLYSRRPNIDKPESVKDDAKQAMTLLRSITKGDIKLEDQKDLEAGSFKTNKTSDDRKFGPSTWDQY